MPAGRITGVGYVKSEWKVAKAMMRNWMKSAGHRKNILNPAFTKIGIGVACKKKHGIESIMRLRTSKAKEKGVKI